MLLAGLETCPFTTDVLLTAPVVVAKYIQRVQRLVGPRLLIFSQVSKMLRRKWPRGSWSLLGVDFRILKAIVHGRIPACSEKAWSFIPFFTTGGFGNLTASEAAGSPNPSTSEP